MSTSGTHRESLSDVLSRIVPHHASLQPAEAEQLVRVCRMKDLQSYIHCGKIDPKSWHDADSGRSLLHYAATSNEVETITFLLTERGLSPNLQDQNGDTPLHKAVMAGHTEAAAALLASRADDTIKNTQQDPPLHVAIKQNSEKGNALVAEFVRHSHIRLFVRGYHGYSSLHIMAKANNFKALELLYSTASELLDASMIKFHLLTKDNNGLTSFHLAARVNSLEVLEFLLSKGSECAISAAELQTNLSHDGRSPFHYAVERGHVKCVEAFLKHGADPTSANGFHPPPLHVACSHGELCVLKTMVDTCGEEILQTRDRDGGTVLHSSTSSVSSKHLISYLVVEKAVCINEVDLNGFSPLSNAIQLGNLTAVDELLSLGADPLIKDKWGCNCLHRAVLGGRMEVFRKLIHCDSARVMATSPDNQGHYPIHSALTLGSSEMVASLLDLSAEEFKDNEGNNYMHLAAASGSEKMIALLLSMPCGSRMINEPNSSSCTPLHFAASKSGVGAVKKLMDHGAVIHKNNRGRTPFMQACSVGNLEAAKLLYNSNKFQRDWVEVCGCSSLHLAVDGGNPEVITFCLDEGTAIVFNERCLTFFDKILDLADRNLAAAALCHSRWEECIDIFSPKKPHPILCILDEIPEVYSIILDHCYSHCTLDRTHSEYWEEFNFKCLNLKQEPQEEAKNVKNSECDDIETINLEEYDAVHTQLHTDSDVSPESLSQVRQSIAAQTKQERGHMLARWFGKKRVEEQSLIVIRKLLKTRQEDYLLHPVVKEFISLKWVGYGTIFQATIMVLHFLLAFFFSVFLVDVGPPPQSSNDSLAPISQNNQSDNGIESDYDSITADSEVLLILTLLLSIVNLLVFFLQVYIHGVDLLMDYFSSVQIWMNFVASFCILLFLLSVLARGLREALWNSAALGTFFAWFSFGTTLQLVNVLRIGVYVTMMLSTARLVIKVLIILLPFLFGFSFAFFVLVGTVTDLQYSGIGLSFYSLVHSLIAVTDYLGFARIEQETGFRFDVLTFMLLIVLVVMVPIVFVNLLIGLAVGDIATIQRDATISHLAVEVHALASLDKYLLPHRFFKHLSKKVHKHYPNKKWLGSRTLAKIYHRRFEPPRGVKEGKVLLQELQAERKMQWDQFRQLQERMEQLAADQQAQVEGIKLLETLMVKLMDAQIKS